jgi:hypothetical protein
VELLTSLFSSEPSKRIELLERILHDAMDCHQNDMQNQENLESNLSLVNKNIVHTVITLVLRHFDALIVTISKSFSQQFNHNSCICYGSMFMKNPHKFDDSIASNYLQSIFLIFFHLFDQNIVDNQSLKLSLSWKHFHEAHQHLILTILNHIFQRISRELSKFFREIQNLIKKMKFRRKRSINHGLIWSDNDDPQNMEPETEGPLQEESSELKSSNIHSKCLFLSHFLSLDNDLILNTVTYLRLGNVSHGQDDNTNHEVSVESSAHTFHPRINIEEFVFKFSSLYTTVTRDVELQVRKLKCHRNNNTNNGLSEIVVVKNFFINFHIDSISDKIITTT